MATWFFSRHGESVTNVSSTLSNRDLPHSLTERGRDQALKLAEKLVTRHVRRIYSSPILRARETAELVAGACGVEVTVADELKEFDCGVMEGRGDDEAWEAYNLAMLAWENGHYEYRISGGESFNDMRRRFVPFVEQLFAEQLVAEQLAANHESQQGSVLLMSHGSILHLMLPEVLTNIDYAFSKQHQLTNCAYVVARPLVSGLSCVEWDQLEI